MLLLVCAFPALAAPRDDDAPDVVAVELHLPEGRSTEGLAGLVTVRKGQALTPGAVRKSVEQLFATGRFADVVALTQDVPGGVRLVFQLTPLPLLSHVAVRGNHVLTSGELLEASGLLQGGPLDPEELDTAAASVREAYQRKGYDAVDIQVEQRPVPAGGVAVTLVVEEGKPTRVRQVTFSGSPALPLPRLVAALGMKPGEVFDRARLDGGLERLRALLREGQHWQAWVGTPTIVVEDSEASVAVPVAAGPAFHLRFTGNHRFPDAVLARVVAYDGEEAMDEAVAARLARRLEAFYRRRGFHDARVRASEAVRPDGDAAVLGFQVDEGALLRVTDVRFHGNAALSSGALRSMLTNQVAVLETWPELDLPMREDPLETEGRERRQAMGAVPPPDPSTVYVEDAWLDAADAMTATYREQGFASAQVTFRGLTVDAIHHTAEADFDVEEGPRALMRAPRFEGMPPEVDPTWVKLLLPVGQPLSFERVEQAQASLERGLGREGFLFARVSNAVSVDGEGTAAQVVFRVDAGPRVRVGQVLLQGLTRTDPDVVLALLGLKPGAPLSVEGLAEAQRRLSRLGLFRQAEVSLADPNRREASKDVLVTVQERPRIDGEVSGGYFLVDGPRITLDTAWRNLDGRGLNLLARGKVNYAGASAEALSSSRQPAGCSTGELSGEACESDLEGLSGLGGRGNLALSQPRLSFLAPQEIGARLDLIGERAHRPSYLSTRFAAVAGVDWALASWVNVSLQYELENNRLRSRAGVLELVNRADQERLRYPYGDFALHSLRPSMTLDFRDDPANPRRGMVLSTSVEFMRGIRVRPTDVAGSRVPEFPIDGVKLSGSVSAYAPLGRRASVAVSARAGTIVPLTQGSQNIGSKLFYLGGSSSLRGFREDGVLPQDVREGLHQRLAACRAVITPAGCPDDLKAVLAGQVPASQGGELYTLGKAELRVPAVAAVDLGLFFEVGNLWQDRTLFDLGVLRYTAGVGLRYVTPVGPLAFDVGFNLDRDEALNEAPTQFHFSIGTF
ncbi:POTRA domain-containing protein [Corallococcus silvisoli]|uniref:POTRA domain-containing protein n=1 Tax=Corallococcus silvisoli TaxID=2697031 RepID=UPI0013776485|nr:POTRA domain-containing protein [Corallococcus silvisoli]NBD11556.1 BamA/TamA family outer membrane protein [Corallococcus silvisoli]